MKRHVPLMLSLLALSLAGAVTGAEPSVEDLLPADAILAVCYYGDNPDIQKTALHQLMQEPEVREWLTSVRETVRGANQLAAGFLGINVATLTPLLGSRLGFALLPGAGGAPQVLVVAKVGKEGDARNAVGQFLNQIARAGGARQQVGGIEVIPLGPGGACFGFRDEYLFVSTSTQALERALSPQAPKLSGLPSFRRALGMGSSPVAVVAYNHVATMEAFGPMVPPELTAVLDGLGVGQTELLVLRLGAKGRALVGTGVVQTHGERKGLLKALAAPPVDKALLKLVPRGASIAWVSNVSPEELYASVIGFIHVVGAAAMEEDLRGGLAAFEAKAGVNLRKDIFGSLARGTAVTTSGKSLIPALIISLTLKDGDRFEQSLAKLVAELDKFIKAEAGQEAGAALRTIKFGEHTIRYLATPGVPVPLAPCYARAGGRLILALSPIHLKDYLMFLDGEEPSILDNPGFQKRVQLVPDNAISIGYSDAGEAFIELYSFLGPLLTAAQGVPNNPLAMDFANLPSKRTLRKHLFGSISYTYATKNTLVYECQSPFGVPFVGPAPAGAPAVVFLGVGAAMVLPALGRARGEARRTVSLNNMRQLAMACLMFVQERKGVLPSGLADLFKNKLIEDPKLLVAPNDRAPPKGADGRPCSYVYFLDAQPRLKVKLAAVQNVAATPLLWEREAFGRRGPRRGPRRRLRGVAFMDGHVEMVGEPRFLALKAQLDALLRKLAEKQGIGQF